MTTGDADASGTQLTASVHWLTGVASGTVWPFLDLAVALTDGGEVEVLGPRNFYRSHHHVAGIIRVLSDPIHPDTMPDVCVDVAGKSCEWLGWDRLGCLVAALDALTRVDVPIDHVGFTPVQVRDADYAGNIRTRGKKSHFREGLRGRTGDTYTLGTAASSRQLVVYDERGFTRAELRLRDERAEDMRDVLLGPSEGLLAATVGRLSGYVEFVDAVGESNVSRAPALAWWAEFVGMVERVVMPPVVRVAAAVEGKVAWLVTMAPMLAALVAGGLDLPMILGEGMSRWKARHRAVTHQMTVVPLT